jgi:hypothetical protein
MTATAALLSYGTVGRRAAMGRQFQFAAFECSLWAVNVHGKWLSPLDDWQTASFRVDRSAAPEIFSTTALGQPSTFVRAKSNDRRQS